MKIHAWVWMLMAAVGCLPVMGKDHKELENLGRVMYIGDSITHGFRAPSYRWPLHKIFVDNGVKYVPIGVEKGNRVNEKAGGLPAEISYRGVPFLNVHCAMSSERAYEVSGRLHNSPRLDQTDIFDWLGLDKDYHGPRKIEGDAPDTCFLLIGTNDTLSDYGSKGGIGANIKEVQTALLDPKKGDIPVILQAIRKVNPKAKIVILPIPAWGKTATNNTAPDYASIMKYNQQLHKMLSRKMKKVIFADVNQGLVDIACEDMPGKGVGSFFHPVDQLHPTPHGDLIMAGLVARAMGYPGRTAAAERKEAAAFAYGEKALLESMSDKENTEPGNGGFSLKPGAKTAVVWQKDADPAKGFTVELLPHVGNGAADGWVKDKGLVLALGNGTHSGSLSFTESYVMWNGKTILYPVDMSTNKEAIRIAWIPGDEQTNLPGGFYVWLGDMLIGEALPDAAGKVNGIVLQNTADESVQVSGLAMDAAAWAPPANAPAVKGAAKEVKE